jgi:hypothetical protein
MALSKQERQQLFVQQRTAELTSAGKPVDAAALTARFNELAATPEGRKQITSKVQLANAPKSPITEIIAKPEVIKPPATRKAIGVYYDGSGADRMRVTEFDDGSTERVAAPEKSATGAEDDYYKKQKELEFQQGVETATTILQSTLKYYGLDEPQLVTDIKTALAERRITGTSTIDDIGVQLRESAAFQTRFAANTARLAAGKSAYSVTQYLQLESAYRQALNVTGMPKDFYDTYGDFQNFIASDISPDEIGYRIQQGFEAVKNADPAVVNELKTLYGLDDSTLAAYFIDPAKTKEAVVKSARAAEIAAQSRQQAGIGLNVTQAESLATQGITKSQAQQGFAQIKQSEQLLNPLMGEDALTQEELIAGTFGTSGAATQRVATTRRRRQASFETGGQTALGTVGQ